jgi:hypothetical protein
MRTNSVIQVVGALLVGALIVLGMVEKANAQIPRMINYQGRLTDDIGQPVADDEYPVRFRIWNDSTDGMVKWTSQPETVLVINGLFNFQLGSKENIPPSTFNDTSLWLGITVGAGPEVPEIEPRTRLVSAPYAFKAYNAEYSGYADSAGTIVSGIGETGEFDGEVNTDMVERAGLTTINFSAPFTSSEKPHMFISVMLKYSANGLTEGSAIKAVEDIKGAAGNWTGFDITASKYSDGSSITDLTQVYVTWVAIGRQ